MINNKKPGPKAKPQRLSHEDLLLDKSDTHSVADAFAKRFNSNTRIQKDSSNMAKRVGSPISVKEKTILDTKQEK